MAKLEIQIGDELHRVVYIDYQKGLPHQVMTIEFIDYADKPYWRINDWNFFANNGDVTDLRAYNSGSGGSHKEIQAPKWADGYKGKFWLAKDANFKDKTRNATRLKNPISVKGYYGNKSINPFKIAEITNSQEYCDRCDHYSTEFCYEHKYEDSKGNARYIDDNSNAE